MRQGIGAATTFNIIIVFIVIVFGLLIGAINYYKAFKVNARMLDIIEKYEGYNSLAKDEINEYLSNIGYRRNAIGCPSDSHGGTNVTESNTSFDYCVYYHSDDRGQYDNNETNKDLESIYYNYSVITYIYIDVPILNRLNEGHGIPVYTKGERTYNFSSSK